MALFGRVAIVGVGLIGGSVGLALKRRRLAEHVVGIGRRESSLVAAREAGAVDATTLVLSEGVCDADLVVFATPVGQIRQLIAAAAPSLRSHQLVTDVGSTKLTIARTAEAALADRAAFVGSHPMAGSEKQGVQFAHADLFEGATCFVTPTERTAAWAVERISGLWRALGGRVRQVDPATHDRMVAAVSQAPHVVAATLVNALDDAALQCVGPGFVDLTRIASSDPGLWTDICAENREPIAAALCGTADRLKELAQSLRQGDIEALRRHFQQAKHKRDSIQPCVGR